MLHITSRQVRRKGNPFDFCAKRRREIVLHARLVGAADSEDFSRWLVAWIWHKPRAVDQIWAVMEAAKRMGGEITEAEASAIIEEASTTRKALSADNLARFLGVTYQQRQHIGPNPTIGSINVGKRARKELRKRADRLYRERQRRLKGVRPRAEYEANSLSRLKPWAAEGISRSTWERRKRTNMTRTQNDASVSATIFLISEDGLASARTASKEALPSSQTVTMPVVDEYGSLPTELRLLALGLPLPDDMQMVA